MNVRPQYGGYPQQAPVQWPPQQQMQQQPMMMAAPRRGGPVPMVPPPHAAAVQQQHLAQLQQQQQQQRATLISMAQLQDEARRRSKKPTDKTMPDGVEEFVLGDGVQQYNRVRDVEAELDAAMMRQRADMEDDSRKGDLQVRTLRIWISNSVDNQPWQDARVEIGEEIRRHGTSRVKIEGRLLDDAFAAADARPASKATPTPSGQGSAEPAEGKTASDQNHAASSSAPSTSSTSRPNPGFPSKLAHFIKSLTITYEKSPLALSAIPEPIVWTKPNVPATAHTLPAAADFDILEFERDTDQSVPITIAIERDDRPERNRLSPPLSSLLDRDIASAKEAVAGVLDYVKCMDLFDSDKKVIRCDERMKAIFLKEMLSPTQIPQLIGPHLLMRPPTILKYYIRISQEDFPDNARWTTPIIYDIPFLLPTSFSMQLQSLSHHLQASLSFRQISQYDEVLALCMQSIRLSKVRVKFFRQLSKDPVGFLNKWTASQSRDISVILAEQTTNADGEEFKRGGKRGVWGSESAREAVGELFATGRMR